jgi:quercetin dioxygenase-like cupin family protein
MLSARKDDQAPFTTETLDVLGAPLAVLSDGGALPLVVGVQAVPPGYGVPGHVHADDDEMFYVLDGELTVGGPQGERAAPAGACLALPRGAPHWFRNATDLPASLLVILTPGAQALAMFREFDRAGRTNSLTPQQVEAIAGLHGVRFV